MGSTCTSTSLIPCWKGGALPLHGICAHDIQLEELPQFNSVHVNGSKGPSTIGCDWEDFSMVQCLGWTLQLPVHKGQQSVLGSCYGNVRMTFHGRKSAALAGGDGTDGTGGGAGDVRTHKHVPRATGQLSCVSQQSKQSRLHS